MKTSRHAAIAVAISILAFAPAFAAEHPAVKADIAAMQGEWTMVSGLANGQSMPQDSVKLMKRVCKGDETTTTMGDQIYFKAKFTIDPAKSPKTIDYDVTGGFTKGKKQLGIYEVNGDTLKFCVGSPGADRPTDFTFKPGDGRMFVTWKRQKEPAAKPDQK
jgi:uncharacterized protein (TIGR03067 family)